MNIYGYKKESDELLELSEISLECSIEELDSIIDFLKYAKDLKIKNKDKYGHEHFKDWAKEEKLVDIIIL